MVVSSPLTKPLLVALSGFIQLDLPKLLWRRFQTFVRNNVPLDSKCLAYHSSEGLRMPIVITITNNYIYKYNYEYKKILFENILDVGQRCIGAIIGITNQTLR